MLYLRLWLGPLLVALRFAMYNVLPVLEMSSYLQIMARNRRSEKAYREQRDFHIAANRLS